MINKDQVQNIRIKRLRVIFPLIALAIVSLIFFQSVNITTTKEKKLNLIFQTRENYKEIFDSLSLNFLKKYDFLEKQIEYIFAQKKKIKLEVLQQKLDARQVRIITIHDLEYPENLREVPNPPYLFYLRGNIDNTPKISVVGSRKMTSY